MRVVGHEGGGVVDNLGHSVEDWRTGGLEDSSRGVRLDGTKYTSIHKTQFGDLHCVVLSDVGELAVVPGVEPAREESLGVGGRDVHRVSQARQKVAGEWGLTGWCMGVCC